MKTRDDTEWNPDNARSRMRSMVRQYLERRSTDLMQLDAITDLPISYFFFVDL